MTAGNLFCGFMAIVQCIQARLAETTVTGEYNGSTSHEHYKFAVWFIFGAAAFDALDGRLARMGGRESLFGAEFDSLADVISFGMAPALLMFYLILSPTTGSYEWFRNIGWLIGFVYLLCAAMRLARFNVITNPLLHPGTKESSKDFVGLPVVLCGTNPTRSTRPEFSRHTRCLRRWIGSCSGGLSGVRAAAGESRTSLRLSPFDPPQPRTEASRYPEQGLPRASGFSLPHS